jgi:hypothetical protein
MADSTWEGQLVAVTPGSARMVRQGFQTGFLVAVKDLVAGLAQDITTLADRQAKIGKGEVEIPAREMLAEMLPLSGKPAEALVQYQQSLLVDPNRFNALLGGGRGSRAKLQHDLNWQAGRTFLAAGE